VYLVLFSYTAAAAAIIAKDGLPNGSVPNCIISLTRDVTASFFSFLSLCILHCFLFFFFSYTAAAAAIIAKDGVPNGRTSNCTISLNPRCNDFLGGGGGGYNL